MYIVDDQLDGSITIYQKNETIIDLDFLICQQVCRYLRERIDQANIARKEAKKDNHCKLVWFNEDMQKFINKRKILEIEIQNALRNKLFTFYLQPKVNINTGKIVGSEALARLIKDNKVIYPDQFIEIMELTI